MKLGVIGYGLRARTFIENNLLKPEPGLRIEALADPRAGEYAGEFRRLKQDPACYHDVDAMLAAGHDFDGLLIGTRCDLHTPLAVKVLPLKIPLFLEKPVSINEAQLTELEAAAGAHPSAAVTVSFPLRLSPFVQRARDIVQAGELGTLIQVQSLNNVPYGAVYSQSWYRDTSITGGMFLQKATHDFDYISHILGEHPVRLVARSVRGRYYGGTKTAGLQCRDCREWRTCPESPYWKVFKLNEDAGIMDKDSACAFGEDLHGGPVPGNEDASSVIFETASGIQGLYAQNFVARRDAAERGCRIIGSKGTVRFDWYRGVFEHIRHHGNRTEVWNHPRDAHGGGDIELGADFLSSMRGQPTNRSPLQAGITSARVCLACVRSSRQDPFVATNLHSQSER
ncbi:MAG: Gfo/Idh/MocA family oxidoreductase [Kiritimatiellia bacterium]